MLLLSVTLVTGFAVEAVVRIWDCVCVCVCVWQKSEIESFNAAALDKQSQYEQTKASLTPTHSGHVPVLNEQTKASVTSAQTVEGCQCVSDLKLESEAVGSCHLVTSSSSSSSSSSSVASTAATAAVAYKTDKTLSQLEEELFDSLLSIWQC